MSRAILPKTTGLGVGGPKPCPRGLGVPVPKDFLGWVATRQPQIPASGHDF